MSESLSFMSFAIPLTLACLGSYRTDFIEIMELLDKRMNDKGKLWRHVFKVRTTSLFKSTD